MLLPLPARVGPSLKRKIYAAILLLVVFASASAFAGKIPGFLVGNGGIVEYEFGGHHPRLYGSGIRVQELMYGPRVFPMLLGRLTFSGGSFMRSDNSSYLWGPGGRLSVTGCVDINHNGKCDSKDFRGKLLTGSFLDARLVDRNGQEFLEAQLVEQINPQLAALLHLTQTKYSGAMEFTLTELSHGHWWAHDHVQGGFLNGHGNNIPEASSIWLLSTSLACWTAIGWGCRRRKSGVKQEFLQDLFSLRIIR